ncbi:MAG: hypothetical protein E7628_01530 [Ruminococcaceae bacterium]|nr:hypothetical protein [Oscillospiraceae bacterium]
MTVKKILPTAAVLSALPLLLSSCSDIGSKDASTSLVYLMAAIFSLILLGMCLLIRDKDPWLVVLFASVLVVNTGYYMLSVSSTLQFALWANRISYLGSVFLPISMLMIILKAVDIKFKKWCPYALCGIGSAVFLIAASPGILDIYYKEVTLVTKNGVSMLEKVYGPLHVVNLIYLLGIFSAIVASIILAIAKKKISSPVNSVILASAVFINIGVWFIEQIVDIDFEVLSVSYIVSEIFLLAVNVLMAENERLKIGSEATNQKKPESEMISDTVFAKEDVAIYVSGQSSLTQTERMIFDLYTTGKTTREIMAEMHITENTLKFHNKNIYSKLGVSSRKQLVEIYKYISTGE